MKHAKRIVCLILAMILLWGWTPEVCNVNATEMTQYSLAELLKNDQIKTFGRTSLNLAGDGIKTDWSASGFEMKLDSRGGEMTVTYRTSYDIYWAVMVNGEQCARIKADKGDGSFSATLPEGAVTVSIVKDTQVSTGANDYADLLSVAVPGTLLERPADRELYIEFIGDSYSCGDGAVGIYQPGVAWQLEDHAATKAFTYLTAKALNADYSIVARGGIGLTKGAGGTMPQIYAYTSGYRDKEDVYGFARKPDVIVVELGANDGVGDLATWKSLLSDFVDQIREKNGPEPQIVFYTHKTHFSCQMLQIIEQRAETDPNLHICHYSHNGFGSAALATQKEGHPGEQDHKDMAQALTAYLRTEILQTKPEETEPGYTDIVYRVENTDLKDVVDRAVADHGGVFPDGSRLVLHIGNAALWTKTTSLSDSELKRGDGSKLPILITSAPESYGKRTLLLSGLMNVMNDVTFRNVTLQTPGGGYLRAVNSRLVLDNVSAAFVNGTDGKYALTVSAGYSKVPEGTPAPESEIIFRSGDYTNMLAVGKQLFTDLEPKTVRLVVEEGAVLGDVWGRVCEAEDYVDVTVELKGGTVRNYKAMVCSGGKNSPCKAKGSVTTILSGTIVTESFVGADDYVKMEGTIENRICGGEIRGSFRGAGEGAVINELKNTVSGGMIRATSDICLGGGKDTKIETLINTVSGGKIYRVCGDDDDCGIYFGADQKGSVSQLENRITGGAIAMIPTGSVPTKCGIWLGSREGSIGTLTNRFTNGCLDLSMVGVGGYYLGSRDGSIGTLCNTLGTEGQIGGPRFLGSGINTALAGENAEVKQVENGIHSATFQDTVYAGTMGKGTVTGSVTNTIHNGMFENFFYCGSKDADIEGQVNTEILGGVFCSVYGGSARGVVYDGVSLTVRYLQEYTGEHTVYGGSGRGNLPAPKTPGRPSAQLILAPAKDRPLAVRANLVAGSAGGNIAGNVELRMDGGTWYGTVTAGCTSGDVTGSTYVCLYNATFPEGLKVKKATLADILAPGAVLTVDGQHAQLPAGATELAGEISLVTPQLTESNLKVNVAAGADGAVQTQVKVGEAVLVPGRDYTLRYLRDNGETTDLKTPGILVAEVTVRAGLTGTVVMTGECVIAQAEAPKEEPTSLGWIGVAAAAAAIAAVAGTVLVLLKKKK